MEYTGKMDPECIKLCDAINSIDGLDTIESCCGHGKRLFRIWFIVNDLAELPVLLYYCDPCHVGFRWDCTVHTDCGMSPVVFLLSSQVMGEEAYQQANIIADEIVQFLEKEEDEED